MGSTAPSLKPAKAELEKAEADLKVRRSQAQAKVIDPEAESTTVTLKITDMGKMRRQLDAIAADVVNFQCDVSIQVPRTHDYPWVANVADQAGEETRSASLI